MTGKEAAYILEEVMTILFNNLSYNVFEQLEEDNILNNFIEALNKAYELLDLEDIVEGHWIIQGDENEFSKCSVCGYTHNLNYVMDAKDIKPFKFCPDCGAIMKNGEWSK